MPIRKVKGGYKWGGHGHVYKNRKGAERQAAAAHAHGFKEEVEQLDEVMKPGQRVVATQDSSGGFSDEKNHVKKGMKGTYKGSAVSPNDGQRYHIIHWDHFLNKQSHHGPDYSRGGLPHGHERHEFDHLYEDTVNEIKYASIDMTDWMKKNPEGAKAVFNHLNRQAQKSLGMKKKEKPFKDAAATGNPRHFAKEAVDALLVKNQEGFAESVKEALATIVSDSLTESKELVANHLLEVSAGAMSRAKEHRSAQQAAYHHHMYDEHMKHHATAVAAGDKQRTSFHKQSAAAHSTQHKEITGLHLGESVEEVNEDRSGQRVRIHYPEHMRRGLGAVFHGKTGTIQGHEMDGRTKMHRVVLDEPAHVEGIGHVHDDLWQGSYLKKLREDTEQIDELKKSTLASYIGKAAFDMGQNVGTASRHEHDAADYHMRAQRSLSRASSNKASKFYTKAGQRQKGIKMAAQKLAKEGVEEVNELSKGKLTSYIRHSAHSAVVNAASGATAKALEYAVPKKVVDPDAGRDQHKKSMKRLRGIEMAVHKIQRKDTVLK